MQDQWYNVVGGFSEIFVILEEDNKDDIDDDCGLCDLNLPLKMLKRDLAEGENSESPI